MCSAPYIIGLVMVVGQYTCIYDISVAFSPCMNMYTCLFEAYLSMVWADHLIPHLYWAIGNTMLAILNL